MADKGGAAAAVAAITAKAKLAGLNPRVMSNERKPSKSRTSLLSACYSLLQTLSATPEVRGRNAS
jgi:hypothetical protein